MLIRAATPDDVAALVHVHVESWRSTYRGIVPESYLASLQPAERAVMWREALMQGVAVFVADLHGRVVGFVSGGAIRDPLQSFAAEIYAIYLLKEAQRAAIGTALFQTMAADLRRRAYSGIAVWVLEVNPACRFYEKMGGSPVSSKTVDIGGLQLPELCYGWPSLENISPPA